MHYSPLASRHTADFLFMSLFLKSWPVRRVDKF